jgi:PAS domain S-box-containing protein
VFSGNRLTASRKLQVATFCTTLAVFAVAAAGLWGSMALRNAQSKNASITAVLRNHLEMDMVHDALRADVLAALVASELGARTEERESILADVERHAKAFRALVDLNHALPPPVRAQEALASVRGTLTTYVGTAQELAELAFRDRAETIARLPNFTAQYLGLETAMVEVSNHVEVAGGMAREAGDGAARLAGVLMVAGLTFALVVAFASHIFASRTLVSPLVRITAAIRSLAGGNLHAEVPFRNRRDEIGAMATAFEVFRGNAVRLQRREAELWETNRRFAAALTRMSQGLCMVDAEERVAVVNLRFCEITGLPPDQVRPGMTYRDLLALGTKSGLFPAQTVDEALHEHRVRATLGKAGDLVRDFDDGRAVAGSFRSMAEGGWVFTAEDITERRMSEAFRAGQVTVLEMIASGQPLAEVLTALCHIAETQLPGSRCSVLLLDPERKTLHLGAAPSLPESYNTAIEGIAIGPAVGSCGTAAYRRERVAVSDIASDLLWVGYRSVALAHGLQACWSEPVLSRTGEVLGTFAIYYGTPRVPTEADIARQGVCRHMAAIAIERQRTEGEIREAGETLSTLIEASPVAILGLDPELRIQTWNSAAERIFGRTAAEMRGELYTSLLLEEDLRPLEQRITRMLRGEVTRNVQVRCRRKDGTLLNIQASGAALSGKDGIARGFVVALEDVTGQHAIEEQLRQAQKMEAVGQLTGGIAHDFNNLLGIVIGNLDLLREQTACKPDAVEILDEALEAALSGAALTRRLLAFARRQPLQPRRIEANDLIGSTAKLLGRTLGELIEVKLAPSSGLWPVMVDPVQLEAALTNLAVNARDAMPKGGRLTIATRNAILDAGYAAVHPEVQPGK